MVGTTKLRFMRIKKLLILFFIFSCLLGCGINSFYKKYTDFPLHNFSKKNYAGQDRFHEHVSNLHYELGKKYGIKEFWFDTECIYQKEDLTGIIDSFLHFGEFNYEFIDDGLDSIKKEYYSIYNISDLIYEFRTTALSDWIEYEQIFPALDSITSNLKPEYEYNFSNIDGGQVACLIFGKSQSIDKAVDEGYPCSRPNGRWNEINWKWGVYSEVTLKEIPDFDSLLINYHSTIDQLYEAGFQVPRLTINRIYIDTIFNGNSLDIVIDGGPMTTSFNDIENTTFKCFWDGWGILLAYTLITHYEGVPFLYDKTEKVRIELTKEEYLKRVRNCLKK